MEGRRSDAEAGYRTWDRRHYLVATAGLAALSGCLGGTEDGGRTDTTRSATETDDDEELPEGVSREQFEHGPVPEAYRTATSQGGKRRNEAELVPKADVQFSEYDEALGNGAHRPGRCCANCAEFVPDRDGDGWGACAKVEGYVAAEDWCSLWQHVTEEL